MQPAEAENDPERTQRGLSGRPLRSVYTLVVLVGLLLVVGLALLTGRGEECKTIPSEQGSEEVCLGQFPDEVGDFTR